NSATGPRSAPAPFAGPIFPSPPCQFLTPRAHDPNRGFSIPQKEDAMKRFLNWLGRSRGTRSAAGNRPRTFRPQLEPLDNRLVLSAISSAVSIQHPGGTERDWFTTVDDDYVFEFQGTKMRPLGGAGVYLPGYLPEIIELSASVDPYTGFGEVFVCARYGRPRSA